MFPYTRLYRWMAKDQESLGLLYGLLGMLAFSLTLPVTRVAVTYFDPIFVGAGRVCLAAIPAAFLLYFDRNRPRLTFPQFKKLIVVSFGVAIAFPILSAYGMTFLPAAHGAILFAVLPLTTAVAAALLLGERPSLGFWVSAFAGAVLVLVFSMIQGGGEPQIGDLLLILSVFAGALGYAEGGRLAVDIGGWRVICWAVLIGSPVALTVLLLFASPVVLDAPFSAWLAFAYVAFISQLAGFFVWYKGLALGGVAKVGQVQLLMPFFSLLGAFLLLGERLSPAYFVFAGAVVAMVALNRKMPVVQAKTNGSSKS